MRFIRLAVLALLCAGHAPIAFSFDQQQRRSQSAKENGKDVPVVKVQASPDVAELSYRFYLEVQHQLHKTIPSDPHLVDLWFRVGYPDMSEVQRDAYVPHERAVALRSKSVDMAVPSHRGAYFSLPAIQDAYDQYADLVICGTSKPRLSVWWTLRVPDNMQMSYSGIRAARAQIATVQGKISAFSHQYLKNVKRHPYDGIKACFHDATGEILIDGKAVGDVAEGDCKVLFDDPRIKDDSKVEFSGALAAVSFIDRSYYR
jgi:hypothetical protein